MIYQNRYRGFCSSSLLALLNWVLLLSVVTILSEFDDYVQCGGDHWEYQSIAVNFVEGHGFMRNGGVSSFETYKFRRHNTEPFAISEEEFYSSSPKQSFYRSPIYPLFLAGVYKAFGVRPIMVKRIQLGLLCLGASLLIPIGFVAAGKSGMLAGLLSSVVFVYSFYGICGKLYSESLLSFIASLVMLSWLLVLKKRSLPTAMGLGLILGLGMLAKGGFYIVTLCVLVCLFWRFYKLRTMAEFKVLTMTACTVLLTVLPYVLWQNQWDMLSSNSIFISNDGAAALLGGNNEFTTEGNWVYNNVPNSYYSAFPTNMNPISKVLHYYTEFPERIIPNAYRKLRNSFLRPVPGSVLVFACLTFLFFFLFKNTFLRISSLIGVSAYLGINFFSANYLHYRFIDRTFPLFTLILSFFILGLIVLIRKKTTKSILTVVFPFIFSLSFLTLILYGHYRMVMPFYQGALLLGFSVFIILLQEVFHSQSVKQLRERIKAANTRTLLNYSVLLTLPWFIPLLVSETYLRIDGKLDTYAEKTGNPYRSYYNQEPPSFYWNHPMNTTYTIDQGDFSYEYETNEIGLREKRNAISYPDTNAFRILTLGDSFTEGFGTSADSAWPRVLERRFELVSTHSKNIQVYNAGMAGSDPFFNYRTRLAF